MPEIYRGNIVKRVGMAGGTLATAALLWSCSGENKTTYPSPFVEPTPTVLVTPEPKSQNISDSIQTLFPEIKAANLKLKETIDIKLPSRIPTKVLNFTNLNIQPDVLTALYGYVEQAPQVLDLNGGTLNINGNDRTLNFALRKVLDRTLDIFPSGTPRLFDAGISYQEGVTIYGSERLHSISRTESTKIPTLGLNTDGEGATFATAVEACQELIQVNAFDDSGILTNEDEQRTVQEWFCNSFGLALAYRLLDKSFEDYKDITLNFGVSTFENGVETNKLLHYFAFSKNLYMQLNPKGPILK